MTPGRKDIARIVQTHIQAAKQHATSLSRTQFLYASLFGVVIVAFTVLFITFHSAIFRVVEAWKGDLLGSRWKWLLLVAVTAGTSVPPLIGFSTSVTLAGYVFGFVRGWGVAALGAVGGASLAFVLYRHLLLRRRRRSSHVVGSSPATTTRRTTTTTTAAWEQTTRPGRLGALTKALEGGDGFALLCMIRLCPLPFSLANAALATVPTVTFPRFFLATVLGTARLVVHVFVGSRIARLADGEGGDGDGDGTSRLVNTAGIVVGISLGVVTGYLVYRRTQVIAARMAQQMEDTAGREREESSIGLLRGDDDDGDDDDLVARDRVGEQQSLLK